jgi:FixJ family two-component response regulator
MARSGSGPDAAGQIHNGADATIYVVDDDLAVRTAVSLLVESCGWQPRAFASAEEFLDAYEPGGASCLLLDLQMPGMSGVELQRIIADVDLPLPVIVITAHHDRPIAAEARAAGALSVVAKPFRDQELIDAIRTALAGATPAGGSDRPG